MQHLPPHLTKAIAAQPNVLTRAAREPENPMIKTTLVMALAASCSLSALADIAPQPPLARDAVPAGTAQQIRMPPICWIIPTLGCL